MVNKQSRSEVRVKKHNRMRNRFAGTAERPRLAVFRSNNHMYAQIIDDTVGNTLVAASTVEKEVSSELEKTNDKHFRFTLTTNGVLLNDEVQEFVNKEMDNVVLSLDGRKEVNDRMRPFRNGKGSYDLIVPKFQKLAESRNQEKYYIRGTFTRENLDFSEDVLHFADLGFEQISIEPVAFANLLVARGYIQ